MTKPVKKWPGELGKPIRRLPIDMMTHGGRITEENADAYNADAEAKIDKALEKVRRSKIPLLAQYYGVGSQNYAGLAKAIAKEFIRNFDGDLKPIQDYCGISEAVSRI